MHAEASTHAIPSERSAASRSRLDRALSVITDVRPGEATTALLLLANLFVALASYYLLKTLREPLVLASGGATSKSYAAGVQALLLFGLVPLYGHVASRISPRRLVVATTLASAAVVELFAILARAHVPHLGFAFFVFVGMLGVFSVAQSWSFATDLHDEGAGRRLFPLIGVGATVGSVVGSLVAGRLFGLGFSIGAIFHLAAGGILIQALLYVLAMRAARTREASAAHGASAANGASAAHGASAANGASGSTATSRDDWPLDPSGAFALVAGSPHLRLLTLALVVMSLVNTNGEFLLSHAIVAQAEAAFGAVRDSGVAREAFVHSYVGGFYGDFFLAVNVATVALQMFVASRLVKLGGLRAVLLAAPIVGVVTYGLAASALGFMLFRVAKTAENACDYSLGNTAKAMVWLPLPREQKYKAKQAIDTFFIRFGDVASALAVFALVEGFALPARVLAVVNVGLSAVVLVLLLAVARRHDRLSAS